MRAKTKLKQKETLLRKSLLLSLQLSVGARGTAPALEMYDINRHKQLRFLPCAAKTREKGSHFIGGVGGRGSLN